MTDESKALVPIEQKTVTFYGDEIIAVQAPTGEVYIPLRQICDFLGVNWSGQRQRILRDPVLSEELQPCVVVTHTQGQPDQRRELLALRLDYLAGFLFGINAGRVKEKIRDRLIRYQREAYQVLHEAFQEGRLTAGEDFEALLQRADPDVVQAYQMARAVVRLARNQILMETRLTGRLDDHERRLEEIETTLGDPGHTITPAQATHISQAVKAIAYKLSDRTGRNEFGGVWGEFYRKFEIPTYRELPAAKYDKAMEWLTEWWQQIAGSDEIPF